MTDRHEYIEIGEREAAIAEDESPVRARMINEHGEALTELVDEIAHDTPPMETGDSTWVGVARSIQAYAESFARKAVSS